MTPSPPAPPRALLAAVVVMGILIVAGVAIIGVTIVRRVTSLPAAPMRAAVLHAPDGATIVAAAPLPGGGWSVVLHGGGPDRVVTLDPRTGETQTVVTLSP